LSQVGANNVGGLRAPDNGHRTGQPQRNPPCMAGVIRIVWLARIVWCPGVAVAGIVCSSTIHLCLYLLEYAIPVTARAGHYAIRANYAVRITPALEHRKKNSGLMPAHTPHTLQFSHYYRSATSLPLPLSSVGHCPGGTLLWLAWCLSMPCGGTVSLA